MANTLEAHCMVTRALVQQIHPGLDVSGDKTQRQNVNAEAETIVLMLIFWDKSQHRLDGKYTLWAEFFPCVNSGLSVWIRKCNQRLSSSKQQTCENEISA